jgi:nucleoside-diphosphate-sugar epimerase
MAVATARSKDDAMATAASLAHGHAAPPDGGCHLVVTSSMAAVRASGQVPSNGLYYTHHDWNTQSQNRDSGSWGESYQWSKTMSEKRAWELGQELGVHVTAMCPSFVFGPPLGQTSTAAAAGASSSPSESYSLTLVDEWIRGESPVQSRLFVDVRDVARAHVRAASNPDVSAGRRYIVSTEARVPSRNMAEWLREECRGLGQWDPSRIRYDADYVGGAIPIGQREVESVERLQQDLGVTLRPVRDTMVEMARALFLRRHDTEEKSVKNR